MRRQCQLPRFSGWGAHHVDRSVRKVDESRYDLTVAANLIQLARVPQGHDGAHELDKVLLPFPVCGRTATCISVSVTAAVILVGLTYGCLCHGTSGSSPPGTICSSGCSGM